MSRRIAAPVLLVTGEDETQLADAPEVWRGWTRDLRVARVPGGHFLPEETPQALAELLVEFLKQDAAG